MKAHPYTPQQVIHNLQNMIEQLRDYPPNLEGGPGWCRKQAESIVARGIIADDGHGRPDSELLKALRETQSYLDELANMQPNRDRGTEFSRIREVVQDAIAKANE